VKFLHTSDWHVGRTIRNRSRIAEHQAVFAEIIDIAKHEKVDAVLITGDVFHERRPPLEAEELVAQMLADLARAQVPSVVIPGNHDDPYRLRTLKPLGDLVQVHVVTDFNGDLSSLIVPLHSRDGKEKAVVGCLPYLSPHSVLTAAEGVGASEDVRLATYQSKVQDYFRALASEMQRKDRNAVSLVLAHAHLSECEFGGGEWRSNVFPISAGFLPAHIQYIALGHMHRPQAIPTASSQARYAGSILQMDFGERDQKKSVCLIEVRPGKPASVTTIDLTKGKWLLRRTGPAEEILSQAEDFVDAWVEVVLQPDKRATELIEHIRALPGVLALRFEELETLNGKNGHSGIGRHGDRPARELFTDYYRTKRKNDPDPQLLALFDRLYQEESTAKDEA
jgi:DNA repair protein SbcD/Mre11